MLGLLMPVMKGNHRFPHSMIASRALTTILAFPVNLAESMVRSVLTINARAQPAIGNMSMSIQIDTHPTLWILLTGRSHHEDEHSGHQSHHESFRMDRSRGEFLLDAAPSRRDGYNTSSLEQHHREAELPLEGAPSHVAPILPQDYPTHVGDVVRDIFTHRAAKVIVCEHEKGFFKVLFDDGTCERRARLKLQLLQTASSVAGVSAGATVSPVEDHHQVNHTENGKSNSVSNLMADIEHRRDDHHGYPGYPVHHHTEHVESHTDGEHHTGLDNMKVPVQRSTSPNGVGHIVRDNTTKRAAKVIAYEHGKDRFKLLFDDGSCESRHRRDLQLLLHADCVSSVANGATIAGRTDLSADDVIVEDDVLESQREGEYHHLETEDRSEPCWGLSHK